MTSESKLIIVAMVEFAILAQNEQMYNYAKALAGAENLELAKYDNKEN